MATLIGQEMSASSQSAADCDAVPCDAAGGKPPPCDAAGGGGAGGQPFDDEAMATASEASKEPLTQPKRLRKGARPVIEHPRSLTKMRPAKTAIENAFGSF